MVTAPEEGREEGMEKEMALCMEGYRAHLPVEEREVSHPVLVWKEEWGWGGGQRERKMQGLILEMECLIHVSPREPLSVWPGRVAGGVMKYYSWFNTTHTCTVLTDFVCSDVSVMMKLLGDAWVDGRLPCPLKRL